MKNHKLKGGLVLFLLGFSGVLSLLFTPSIAQVLPEDVKNEIYNIYSEAQMRWMSLINPTCMLVISVLFGTFLSGKVNLRSEIFNKFSKNEAKFVFFDSFIWAITGSFLVFLFSVTTNLILQDNPSIKMLESTNLSISFITKLLYGGITEEILMRWGWMVLFVFFYQAIAKTQKAISYYFGIIISSILFGIGHLPIIYVALNFKIDITIITYIIFLNAVAGFGFGYLFWKKNLETAILAHIFFHVFITVLNSTYKI